MFRWKRLHFHLMVQSKQILGTFVLFLGLFVQIIQLEEYRLNLYKLHNYKKTKITLQIF
jgi:putative effector of murein hydrolase LrgA (UPF0299 family)